MVFIRLLLRVVRTPLLVAVVVSVMLLVGQSRLIYFPRKYGSAESEAFVAGGGVVLAYDTDHGRQRAFFLPGPDPGGRLWLFCPGNAMLALEVEDEAWHWDSGAGWLLIDYPGYGGNAGKPNPARIAANVTGAVQALAAHLGVSKQSVTGRLGAVGQSLGAAAALTAAESLGLQRVVLLSPFTTLTEVGRRTVGWPLCHLNLHRFDNRRSLSTVAARGGRVWIVHGVDDAIVPIRMARELAALAPAAVRLSEAEGVGHNDLWEMAQGELQRVFREARAP